MGCGKKMNTNTVKQRTETGKWHSTCVLISCCLITFNHIGILYSMGTLFTDIMTAFNSTRAETAVIQSAALGVLLCLGIFIGLLINKIGLMAVGILGSLVASVGLMVCFFASSLTYLIISIGVFSGFGYSCLYISSAAAISQHFSGRKQLLYMSIITSASGIGGMLYPYLIRYLSDRYGFRGALLLIGGIGLNTVAGCILWRKKTSTVKRQECTHFANPIDEFKRRLKVKTKSSGEIIIIEKLEQTPSTETADYVYVSQYPVLQDKTETKTVVVQVVGKNSTALNANKADRTLCENIKQTLSKKSFIIFVFGMICLYPTMLLIVIFVADIYQDNGLSKDDVSLGLFLTSVMSIVGRLLPGILLQSKRISPLLLPLINAVVSAVVIFSFIFVKAHWLIIGLTGAIGIPYGACVSLATVVTLELVGSNALPIALGVFSTLNGIGLLVSGPVNGYIRDVTGSYTALFYIAAGMNVMGAVVFYVSHITRKKEKHDVKRISSVFYLTSF